MISEIINLLNYKKVIGVSRNKLDVIPKNYFTNIKAVFDWQHRKWVEKKKFP